MKFNDEDEIISTDMYLKQNNFSASEAPEELELYISRYDEPQIDTIFNSNCSCHISCATKKYGVLTDNAHIVFNITIYKSLQE